MRRTVLLDGNIYDELSRDVRTRALLVEAIAVGSIRVIAVPTVVEELARSPFGRVPNWFAVEMETDSVFVVGHSRIGTARLGGGDVYTAHRGNSNNVPDAVIADSANDLADLVVTNDHRFRSRFSKISPKCQVMNYDQFRNWLRL